MEIEGRYAKVNIGASKVEAVVNEYADGPLIELCCDGKDNSFAPGYIIEVPKEGFAGWEKGALAGVSYGIQKTGVRNIRVAITKISGLITDTTATIVAFAAAAVIFKYANYKPDESLINLFNQLAKESWNNPDNISPENWPI